MQTKVSKIAILVPRFRKTYFRKSKRQSLAAGSTAAPPVDLQQQVVQAVLPPASRLNYCCSFPRRWPESYQLRGPRDSAPMPVLRQFPHGSHRITGVEPEACCFGASTRPKKKVMKALQIIGETGCINQQSLYKYSKLFTKSSSLTSVHVEAMAALFGWASPEEDDTVLAAEV